MAYDPSKHTTTNKPIGVAQGLPVDARSFFYDEALFQYRTYNSTSEVVAYLTTPEARTGQFPIFVNEDGKVNEYRFRNGIEDNNLVQVPLPDLLLPPVTTVDLNNILRITSPDTGEQMQLSLSDLASAISVVENSAYEGPATPTTNPGTPAGPVYYHASTPGTYTNFLNASATPISIASSEGTVILSYNGTSWSKMILVQTDTYTKTAADNTLLQRTYGKNKLDLNEVTTGYFISSAGLLTANTGYNVSNYIPVTEGTNYAFSRNGVASIARWITYFDINYNLVYVADFENLLTWQVPTGYGIKNMRVSYNSAYVNPQLETGTVSTAYEAPYVLGKTKGGTQLTSTLLRGATITAEGTADNSVKSKAYIDTADARKLEAKPIGDNLINPKFFTPGILKSDGSIATDGANGNYNTTDYIPVVAGQTYYSLPFPPGGGVPAGNRAYALYDASKNLIAVFTAGSYASVTIPAGAAYIRVSWTNTLTEPYFGLVNASSPYAYVPVLSGSEATIRLLSQPTIETEAEGGDAVVKRSTVENMIASVLPALEEIDQLSSNLLDPAQFIEGYFINQLNGVLTAHADYDTSGFVPVTPGVTYTGLIKQGVNTTRVFRKVVYFDAAQTFISGIDGWVAQFTPPAGTAYAKISSYGEVWGRPAAWVGLFEGTNPTWEDYGATVSVRVKTDYNKSGSGQRDLLMRSEIVDLINNSAPGTTLTIESSDKIMFTGCSYEESKYSLKNKSWINKLSQFTDYLVANYSVSGQRVIDIADKLRRNNSIYGITPKTYKPTYVTIANNGNEFFPNTGENLDLYTEQIRFADEIIRTLGAKMIIGTSYHVNSNPYVETQLKALALELGVPYMGIGQVVDNITSHDYAGFWGGSHPGTRANASTWLEWLYFITQLPRPRRAIKIFRKRGTVADVSDLLYDNITQRAVRFQELNVGEDSLKETGTSMDFYDRLDEGTTVDPNDENNIITSYTSQENANEYAALMAKQNVAFSDYMLAEFIFDKTNLDVISIFLQADAGLTFYIKDDNAIAIYDIERDAALVFQVTEAVYNSFNEAVGTKFTSALANNSNTQFAYTGKLKSYAMGGAWYLCFTADADIPQNKRTAGAGTIVKVTDGTTYAATFLIKYRYAYDYFARLLKPKGLWTAADSIATVTYESGLYTIRLSDNISNYMRYDKLKLLVYKPGSFNVSDIYATPEGGINKTYKTEEIESKPYGTELVPVRGFDANWLTTGGWSNEGNSLVSMPSGVRDYPPLLTTTSHVELGFDANGFPLRISRTISLTTGGTNRRGFQKIVVRAIARLFPLIYNTDQTGPYFSATPQVTTNSYDMAYLCCSIGASSGNNPHAVIRKPVDIGWAEIIFETILPPYVSDFKVSLWRDGENITNPTFPLQVYDVSVQVL